MAYVSESIYEGVQGGETNFALEDAITHAELIVRRSNKFSTPVKEVTIVTQDKEGQKYSHSCTLDDCLLLVWILGDAISDWKEISKMGFSPYDPILNMIDREFSEREILMEYRSRAEDRGHLTPHDAAVLSQIASMIGGEIEITKIPHYVFDLLYQTFLDNQTSEATLSAYLAVCQRAERRF